MRSAPQPAADTLKLDLRPEPKLPRVPRCSVNGCTEYGIFGEECFAGQNGTWFCGPHYREKRAAEGKGVGS